MKTRKHPSAGRRRTRRPQGKREKLLLDFVKTGVRRFILKGAPISELQKVVQRIVKRERSYRHPLSAADFRRIVREAIQEKARTGKRRKPS